MRHLWSFLAGVVAAPVCWVLLALGQQGSASTIDRWTSAGTYNVANLIEPTVYLVVGGLVLGLLASLRISPLGPVAAGIMLVAPYVGLFVRPFAVRDWIPDGWKLFGDPVPMRLPLQNGTILLLGLLLLMAVFSGQRWRRWPKPTPAVPASTVAAPAVAAGEPAARGTTDKPAGGAPATGTGSDPERTQDWSLLRAPASEPDTKPASLGYPQPDSPPAPRREAGSPWSDPPSPRRDGATH
ncbi:hypothetical protein [Plantactinospora sp. KBS50]|uniref:hypothetical protein n=1 Tax=Plantactinospora sp. KBS50 TaxID=2024580 RepID=UPI000BAAFA18|nr:hypothetical protein [Plantactinospora sp. KBS50]ASW53712.1 hypothetical protein CIK06_05150 [Plantactinospora sp. KBS50]